MFNLTCSHGRIIGFWLTMDPSSTVYAEAESYI